MLANHVLWRLMLFYLTCCSCCNLQCRGFVLLLLIMMQSHTAKYILRVFNVSRIGSRLGGLPHLERLRGKIGPRLRGLPGLADRATRLDGSPHLSCKRDKIKMRDYIDRRVTPPKRVTSPTWSSPEVSRCSRAKQRQRNVQKKCAARAKLLFC